MEGKYSLHRMVWVGGFGGSCGEKREDVMLMGGRGQHAARQNKTHLLGTLELEVGGNGDSEQVLVRVDNRVHDGRKGGDTGSERDGGNGLGSRKETVEQGLLLDIEDIGRKDGTVVVNLGDGHTVSERRDVEHVQQSSFGGTDSTTGLNDLNIGDDFNCTSSNLGWDTKGLEERGLSRFHTGVSTWNPNIVGGNGTSSGGCGDDVGDNDFSDILQVTGSEDETDVSLDVGEELLELRVLREDDSETSSDHGVFTHEDNTLSSERLSDQVGLLRRDVVDVDDEDGGWGLVLRVWLGWWVACRVGGGGEWTVGRQ